MTSLVTDFSSIPYNVTQTVQVNHTVSNTEYINVTQTTTNTEFSNITQTVYATHSITDILTETIYLTSSAFFTVTHTVTSIHQNNFTVEEAEVIAEELVKNLTINSKTTALHLRKLSSADDKRASVKYMGTVGIISVVVPMAILLLSDFRNLLLHIRTHNSIYSRKQA